MRSKWIEFNGRRIFYQDFSGHFFNSAPARAELMEVQEVVVGEPLNSVLVLTDLRNTQVDSSLVSAMNSASARTKAHVHKVAVIGVSGVKRTLGDLLSRLTGQALMYFSDEEAAKEWLARE
jgi:hypothetical protein